MIKWQVFNNNHQSTNVCDKASILADIIFNLLRLNISGRRIKICFVQVPENKVDIWLSPKE